MGRMSLSIYIKGVYEEFHALRREKNKANSVSPQTCAGGGLKKQSQFEGKLN